MKDLYIKTNSGDMYYEKCGSGKSIILLHGWGQSGKTFEEIISYLKDKYTVYVVDFLGFGLSDEPSKVLSIDDYTDYLEMLIKEEKIVDPIILGHSFGGRIAINYASRNRVNKLVLVNSAGISHHGIKYYFRIFKYKLKKVFVYLFNYDNYYSFIRKSGSRDYQNASFIMRGTFKKVVNKDLKKQMKKIKDKTMVIGSVFDKEVKLDDCKKIGKLIKDSELVVFYRSGHFSYLDEKEKFKNVLLRFLEE